MLSTPPRPARKNASRGARLQTNPSTSATTRPVSSRSANPRLLSPRIPGHLPATFRDSRRAPLRPHTTSAPLSPMARAVSRPCCLEFVAKTEAKLLSSCAGWMGPFPSPRPLWRRHPEQCLAIAGQHLFTHRQRGPHSIRTAFKRSKISSAACTRGHRLRSSESAVCSLEGKPPSTSLPSTCTSPTVRSLVAR